MTDPVDAQAKAAQDMIADIETAAEGNAELYTRWCRERFGRPDSRGMWKARAEAAEAEVTRLREALTETLEIAKRNERGDYVHRALAALRAKEP